MTGPAGTTLTIAVLVLTLVAPAVVPITRALRRGRGRDGLPRWPDDWAARGDYLTRSLPAGPGAAWPRGPVAKLRHAIAVWYWYVQGRFWPRKSELGLYGALTPHALLGSGALRLGTLYPENAFERAHPLQVWLPFDVHKAHFALVGPTNARKTTTLGYCAAFYTAYHQQSLVVNDVKLPTEYFAAFAAHWRRQGRHVLNINPWTRGEALAIEPVHAATREQLDIIVEAILNASGQGAAKQRSTGGGDGTNAVFEQWAQQLLRALVVFLRYLPRRACALPTLYRLLSMGAKPVIEMVRWIEETYPSFDATRDAVERLLRATDAELEAETVLDDGSGTPRHPDTAAALVLIDRSGHEIQEWLRECRARVAHKHGRLGALINLTAPEWHAELASLQDRYDTRARWFRETVQSLGTIFDQPDTTFHNIVAFALNGVRFFQYEEMQAAFARPEADLRDVVRRPTLCVIGAPTAKADVGAAFVSSVCWQLILNHVKTRGAEPDYDATTAVHVVGLLDEMPAAGVRKLAEELAIIRSAGMSLIGIYQSDGQGVEHYGEAAWETSLDNFTNAAVLYSTAGTAAKRAAERVGEAIIVKRTRSGNSGAGGGSTGWSDTRERVRRMSDNDITNIDVNGRSLGSRAGIFTGKKHPAFIFQQIPYYEDTFLLERMLATRDAAGTWRLPVDRVPFRRAPQFRVTNPQKRAEDPWEFVRSTRGDRVVDAHAVDALRETVDFLAPPTHRVLYEDGPFNVDLAAIGVRSLVTADALRAKLEARANPRAPSPAGVAPATPLTRSDDDTGAGPSSAYSYFPIVRDLLASPAARPSHPFLVQAPLEPRRYGWREAGGVLVDALNGGALVVPAPRASPALDGAVPFEEYLAAGMHHALDIPTWVFYWAPNPDVSPWPDGAALQHALAGAVRRVDAAGGIPIYGPLWTLLLGLERTVPVGAVDGLMHTLETARDRIVAATPLAPLAAAPSLAAISGTLPKQYAAQLSSRWAESRTMLYELLPEPLDDSTALFAFGAGLLLDLAALGRASLLDVACLATPTLIPPADLMQSIERQGYSSFLRTQLLDVLEHDGPGQLAAAIGRDAARGAGARRLEEAVRAYDLEASVRTILLG